MANGKAAVKLRMALIINVMADSGDSHLPSSTLVGVVLVRYDAVSEPINRLAGMLRAIVSPSGVVDSIGHHKN